MNCNHKHINGISAIEEVLFHHVDKYGRKSIQVDYGLCVLCGKRFIVSG